MPIVSFDNATVAGSAPTREQLAAALTALAFPSAAPSHLTRYGSTEMTTALGDGTYFNGIVTLWDGEFKLIGSEGTYRAQELMRR